MKSVAVEFGRIQQHGRRILTNSATAALPNFGVVNGHDRTKKGSVLSPSPIAERINFTRRPYKGRTTEIGRR